MKHFHQLTQEINLFLSSKQSQALDLLFFPSYLISQIEKTVNDPMYLFYLLSQTNTNGTSQSHSSVSEMSVEEVAMGFIRVANEAMCRPIRALTQVFWGFVLI